METTSRAGGGYNTPNASGSGALGRYQIIRGTWKRFAPLAGLPANAPMTPENQEKVAHAMAAHYARMYHGDKRLMASAWLREDWAQGLASGTLSAHEFYDPIGTNASLHDYIKKATGQDVHYTPGKAWNYQDTYGKTPHGAANVTIYNTTHVGQIVVSGEHANPDEVAKRVKKKLQEQDKATKARLIREFQPVVGP